MGGAAAMAALRSVGLSGPVICSRLSHLLGLVGDESREDDGAGRALPLEAPIVARLVGSRGGGSGGGCGGGSGSSSGLVALQALRPNDVLGVMGGYVLPAAGRSPAGSLLVGSGPLQTLMGSGRTTCRYREQLPDTLRCATQPGACAPLAASWHLLVYSFLRPIMAAAPP